jgi:adhesin transport system outer membrane protein
LGEVLVRGLIAPTLAGCVLLAASSAWAAGLDSEVRGLLSDHPQLAAASAAVSAAKQGEEVAFAGFLPRLTVFGDAGYQDTDRPGPAHLQSSRFSSTAEASWNVFDGYATTARRQSARFSTRIAEESQRQTLQAVLLEAARSYLEVMRQVDLVRLSRSNEAAIKKQLTLEDERVRRGAGIAVDVLLAKSRLQVSKERRTLAEQRLADAESRYAQVFGHAPETAALAAPVLPSAAVPADQQAAVLVLSAEHPALLASQRQIERANEQRRLAQSGYYPSVDLVGRANWEDDVDGVNGQRTDGAVLARLRWDLFSGFATRAEVARAAEEYSAAVSGARQVERKSREALALSWHELETSAERVALLANAVVIAAEVWEARVKLRDAGKETSLNVLDAENELLAACINFVNADFENRASVYRVLFDVGRLAPEALLSPGPGAGQGLAAAQPDSARACGIVGSRG